MAEVQTIRSSFCNIKPFVVNHISCVKGCKILQNCLFLRPFPALRYSVLLIIMFLTSSVSWNSCTIN